MNKDIEGDQCKILWHVDNNKTPHRDPKVVTTIIDIISSIYGRQSPVTVIHGNVHIYIGMTIDLSNKGKVNFTMYDYIGDIIKDLPEYIKA